MNDAEDGDVKREQNVGEYFDFVKSRKRFPGSPRYVGVVWVLQVYCVQSCNMTVSFGCDSIWVWQVESHVL